MLCYVLPVMGNRPLCKVIAEPIKMFFKGFVSNWNVGDSGKKHGFLLVVLWAWGMGARPVQ